MLPRMRTTCAPPLYQSELIGTGCKYTAFVKLAFVFISGHSEINGCFDSDELDICRPTIRGSRGGIHTPRPFENLGIGKGSGIIYHLACLIVERNHTEIARDYV